MADKDKIALDLFVEYQKKRQELFNQLEELDEWYGEQIVLLVEPTDSPL